MNSRTYSLCLLAGLLIGLQTGCTYTASFNRLPYVNMEAVKRYAIAQGNKTPEQITFLKEWPKESYVVLGTLHAPEVEWTAHYDTDDLMKAMRKKAVEIGADAIVDFRFQETPSTHTVGSVSIFGRSGYGALSVVPFKGLHAWGEAIVLVPEDKKALIESK